jgi:hypothetical protein
VRFSSTACRLAVLLAAALLAPAASAASGTFAASDPLLTQIWSASAKTARDMIVPGPLTVDWTGRPCAIALPQVIIDGVVRDRCPYVGDEAVIGRTLDVSTPSYATQRAMLAWFANAQHADGAIPASPLNGGSLVLFDYNAYWIQALYAYVLYSGDVAFGRQVWPHLTALIDRWYVAHLQPPGLLVNDLGPNDYAYVPRHGDVVAYYNAQYVYALHEAAQLAGWLGHPAAAKAWRSRASVTAAAFRRAFWDPRAGAFGDTTQDLHTHPQDANAFAVLSGAATHAQSLSAMAYLSRHDTYDYGNSIVDDGTAWASPDWGLLPQLRVYPFMSYFELQARFELGLDASAFYLIRRTWGYMLRVGPGTMWETIGPYGGPPSDIHPSYDAGWSSGAAPALTEWVLGVTPTSPGFATFTVQPHRADLGWAKGDVPTPHGLIHVEWTLTSLTVRAPRGTRRVR